MTKKFAPGLVLCGTGHRPDKLGGYAAQSLVDQFAVHVLDHYKPLSVISGMALGWDQALARACVLLRIPFTAAIPFAGQERMWPQTSRARYDSLLEDAADVVFVCPPGYAAWKMQQRNQWMVDHAQGVIALWNGTRGGTANCVAYAQGTDAVIANVWNSFARFCQEKA